VGSSIEGVRGGVWYAGSGTFNNNHDRGVPALADPGSGDEMVERFRV